MGKVIKRLYTKLIPEKADRHANKAEIVFCKDGYYHVNFRNVQIKLNEEQMLEWKTAFQEAKNKLKDIMNKDII